MSEKRGYVYIMTNKGKNVFYTGVTSNLQKRAYEHKQKLIAGFTKRYKIDKLVYYEICDGMEGAIWREKQIKAGSRAKKIALVKTMNPWFKDLYDSL